ncbi:MAG: hypothetical protein NTU44_10600, partial [Bacteroidetes bacterium]|nr:hypothetical protein [Bacteroidota bacterium]
VLVYGCSFLAGIVQYDNDIHSPLAAVTVSLYQNELLVAQVLTNEEGHYQFDNLGTGTFRISVSCDLTPGGFTSIDALLILDHLTNDAILTGLRFHAGDINQNSYINSGDAILLLKRLANIITGFPLGNWYFESPVIQLTGEGQTNRNVKGICVGDVNGSYIP